MPNGMMLTAVGVLLVVVVMLRRIVKRVETLLLSIDDNHRQMQENINVIVAGLDASRPKTMPSSTVTRRPGTVR